MPVTLEQAAQNTADAVDVSVINEFRTNALMDLMVFADVVNPVGGGGVMTYGYRRQETIGTAAFRAINAEYVPSEVTTSRHTSDLAVLGGTYQIDRVVGKLGAAATGELALQMQAKIEATKAEFGNAVINGDSSTNPDSFDGLSKALAGSSTEVLTPIDWSGTISEDKGFQVLEDLDNLLALMSGEPTILLSNKLAIAKIKSAARRLGIYTERPGPRDSVRAAYGNLVLQDAGKRPGTNLDVIPVTAGKTDVYAIRIALDGFHGVSTVGGQLIQQWQPDFSTAGAVKTGEVEMGPVAVALKATKAAAVLRGVKLAAA